MTTDHIYQDPDDFVFFVTQEQYDAETRLLRRSAAKAQKRKEKVRKTKTSDDSIKKSPQKKSRMRTRSQVSKRESAHAHGCALLIIKTILSRRPKDLRRSSTFLEHAAAARSSPAIAKFFGSKDPRYTSWQIGRRTDPAYYAELDLISVLRRIAEARSDDYFGSEHFLKPVKRFIQNPLAEKIYSLYKEETFARFAREEEDTMIVEYCNKHFPL
ncbi:Oidioi.mRNA.OKI2018_I69.XSR.g16294.t1.cds [Oikopleura dioica]|uniref:Oidioi.mRNA.OKI2018_I69.XSR.g16294.t1.cds n=1 Tax=Oikopleura dioica TaxID=34765 RepID=A0ABN7SMY2_OIKDI|nr:Oidioi.mRNA.OKI2018_I69.XSR.g16294.t1.cds [Oikopleura dioica]